MSTRDLEDVLGRMRSSEPAEAATTASPLSIEAALAYRDAGNIPDARDRSLRLVLHVHDEGPSIEAKRLLYEPDYLDAPRWRRAGSRPVNVVPLRATRKADSSTSGAWWEMPDVAGLEEEWRRTGKVDGVVVPGAIRSFVFKTVVTLRAAARPVTPDSIADAVSRWLDPAQAEEIRSLLRHANGL